MSIKGKVWALAIVAIIVSGAVSGNALYSLSLVGTKIEKIATEDIPLTELVQKVTIHQLEQAIMFERAARYAEIMANDSHAKKEYKKTKKKFFHLAEKVEKELKDSEKLTAEIIKKEQGNKEIVDEFTHVLALLEKVDAEHSEFDKQVAKVFSLFEKGRLTEAEHLAEKVEAQEDKLDHELEAILEELSRFTAEAAIKAQKIEHEQEELLTMTTIISIIGFLVIAFFIARSIGSSLTNMKDTMETLAGGDTSIEIAGLGRKDEVGQIAEALQVFKDEAIQKNALEKENEETKARMEVEKKAAMQDLANRFQERVEGIISTVAAAATQLAHTAESMNSMINQSSQMASNAVDGANVTSENVQSVASAAEEMSATVQEITSQIQKSNTLITSSVGAVEDADQHAQHLSEASKKVGEVIQLISEIANQINLLALNATIESARAGEAGKGFAVVANEVKNLAGETDKSIEEISKVVGEMNDASTNIISSLENIKNSVSSIQDSSGGIASAIEEQSATTNEVASNMQSAAEGTKSISDNLQLVSDTSNEAGESSGQVLSAARELSVQAEKLTEEVSLFLDEIRNS